MATPTITKTVNSLNKKLGTLVLRLASRASIPFAFETNIDQATEQATRRQQELISFLADEIKKLHNLHPESKQILVELYKKILATFTIKTQDLVNLLRDIIVTGCERGDANYIEERMREYRAACEAFRSSFVREMKELFKANDMELNDEMIAEFHHKMEGSVLDVAM